MKKVICIFIVVLAMSFFISWNGLTTPRRTTTQELASFQGKNNVLQFRPGSNGYDWYVLSFDLSQYAGQTVEISLSMEIWLDAPASVAWQVNNPGDISILRADSLSAGRWHSIQGSNLLNVQQGYFLYLTAYNFNNTSGYIANFDIAINVINITYDNNVPDLHTKWPFYVGAAVFAGETLPTHPISGLLRHYNIITAFMSPDIILPRPWTPTGAYRWTQTDELINYAEANGKKIRGHTLFYHRMTPIEYFKGSGRDGWATKDELYTRMERHARTVFQKYRGRIEYWEVVNEVVGDNGTVRPGPGRESGNLDMFSNHAHYSLYTQIMEDAGLTGMDRYEWVLKAFQLARQYADANGGQNVKLVLNDYQIETNRNKQAELLRLLDYLIANNAPIDGVGIQGHINYNAGRNYVRDLERTIDLISAKRNPVTGRNLIVEFSEPDISLFNDTETSWNTASGRLTLTDRELNTRLRQQATLYRDLFNMCERKYNEGKVDKVIFWGVADRESWLNWVPVQGRIDHPLLFDRNYQPKPAFHELIRGR